MDIQEPSDQTYKAVGHCRETFARTRGVTRNAVDQLMAGNTHDPYPPFRDFFKDVCLTADCDPSVYLNDLQGIYQAARPVKGIEVCDAFKNNLTKAHGFIESFTHKMMDGELDKGECLDLIPQLSELRLTVETLLRAVIDRKNELSGAGKARANLRSMAG